MILGKDFESEPMQLVTPLDPQDMKIQDVQCTADQEMPKSVRVEAPEGELITKMTHVILLRMDRYGM